MSFRDTVFRCSAGKKVCSRQRQTREYGLRVPASSDIISKIFILKNPMHQHIRKRVLVNPSFSLPWL